MDYLRSLFRESEKKGDLVEDDDGGKNGFFRCCSGVYCQRAGDSLPSDNYCSACSLPVHPLCEVWNAEQAEHVCLVCDKKITHNRLSLEPSAEEGANFVPADGYVRKFPSGVGTVSEYCSEAGASQKCSGTPLAKKKDSEKNVMEKTCSTRSVAEEGVPLVPATDHPGHCQGTPKSVGPRGTFQYEDGKRQESSDEKWAKKKDPVEKLSFRKTRSMVEAEKRPQRACRTKKGPQAPPVSNPNTKGRHQVAEEQKKIKKNCPNETSTRKMRVLQITPSPEDAGSPLNLRAKRCTTKKAPFQVPQGQEEIIKNMDLLAAKTVKTNKSAAGKKKRVLQKDVPQDVVGDKISHRHKIIYSEKHINDLSSVDSIIVEKVCDDGKKGGKKKEKHASIKEKIEEEKRCPSCGGTDHQRKSSSRCTAGKKENKASNKATDKVS
jgi:hypothetical protein